VFVVRQDTVERRAVQVGGTDGDRLEIRAGLSGGDRVVVSPPSELAEGRPIVVKGS
jgi:multidrug efflux pump subunit AcrA (membrane-fusion protein)